MRRLTPFAAFLILVFISCGGKDNRKEEAFQLVEIGTLEIPLDTRTSYRTNSLTYWIDSKDGQNTEYLVQLERNIPAIHLYDLGKKQLDFSIKLKEEGPDGVGRPNGLRILSRDSIIVLSGPDRKISLINGKGESIRSCNLFRSGQIAGPSSEQPQSHTTNPLTIYGDKFIFNVAPDRNTWKPEYYDAPTMMEFNFSDCSYAYFNNYPDAMRGAVWVSRGMSYSTTRNDKDQLVSSYSSDHNIHVLDLRDRTKSEFMAKSKFFDELEPLENPGMDTDREYVFTTPSYGAIVYDIYRKVYYRLARHGLKELTDDSEFYDQPFSILILDEAFTIRGETFFPGERYNPHQFFITEDGLYLSTNNDKNPELREDVLSFKLFAVEELN